MFYTLGWGGEMYQYKQLCIHSLLKTYGTSDWTAMYAYDWEKVYFHLKARFKPLPPTSKCSLATSAIWA